ncbi:ABC transporter substrate-binding protein [Radiobacillus deserti]|uniref:Extracellular solute-binding protein n=1 Tax=Radiobacillus deserti TaxID=2594883 RepID=A0A516KE06_9BACI|nr:extracellular solute-binding protein [Radiobacillus deserti]QDP39635.1 extracellular solute-binding protein [Radiobacillus deserti]
MKKWWSLIALIFCLVVLAACNSGEEKASSGGESGSKDDAITVWAWDPKFNIAALEKAKEYYDGESEINVKVIENAQDDIIQKLNTGLSSGTMKGMPNIVLIEDYRAQSFLKSYPDAFFEISDYINKDDFAPYKIATTSMDGKQYGLPFDSGVTGLYVRTDYLEQAGYTVEDLTNITWEKYIEIGKVVKEKTGKDMLTLDPSNLGELRIMIQTAGVWYVKEDGTTPYIEDNEALKQAFQIYKGLMDANIVKINSDWSQFVAAFNSGDVASIPTGNWITPSVKAEASQSGKWAIVPTPKLSVGGSVNASNLGGSSFYVLNIDGKEKAAEFLANTFGSNKQFYQDLVTDIGAIGTYLPAAGGDAYNQPDEFFGRQKIISDFSTWTDSIKGVNYGMHTYAIDDILSVEMQNYLDGKDLDTVLKDAQAQAEAQIK